jgi:hypothetical protein
MPSPPKKSQNTTLPASIWAVAIRLAKPTVSSEAMIRVRCIRRVLTRLADEGLGERRQDSGTYAASERTQTIRRVGLWVDRRLRLGNDPISTLIERLLQAYRGDHVRCGVERVDVTNPPRADEDGILTLGMAAAELPPELGRGILRLWPCSWIWPSTRIAPPACCNSTMSDAAPAHG